MDRAIKLYVNRNLVQKDMRYITLLYPFWGVPKRVLEPFVAAMHENQKFDVSCFELVESIVDADFVLLPHNYWYLKMRRPKILHQFIDEAHAAKKLLLVDGSGDLERAVEEKDTYTFRIGQYRFDIHPNEITLPVFCEDLLERYYDGKIVTRPWREKPSVGFAGWSEMSLKQRIRTTIRKLPTSIMSLFNSKYGAYRKGVFLRRDAVRVLQRSKWVTPNIIERTSYSGSTVTMEKDPEILRREFVENIVHSDYALDVRGDANASTRFYEAISLGRIPVFVDTARVMPLEDIIDYRSFSVRVDYRDLNKLDQILIDFHRTLSPEEFEAMQKKARAAYENYLRMDSFSQYLAARLRTIARTHYGT